MTLQPCRTAILAGSGQAPREAAALCALHQPPFLYIALEGFADPDFQPPTPFFHTLPLGYVGAILDLLAQHQVRDIVMLGAVRRPSWKDFRTDAEGKRWLLAFGKRLFQGDNGILNLVHEQLARRGYRLVGLEDLAPDVLAGPHTPPTRRTPCPDQHADISLGIHVLRALSPWDVGQAVMVHNGVVLGIEGPEGTTALMERCTLLRTTPEGGVLVKAMKTGQNTKLDRPVVGPETVKALVRAKADGLAIQGGGVILLDPPQCHTLLEQNGLFLHVF